MILKASFCSVQQRRMAKEIGDQRQAGKSKGEPALRALALFDEAWTDYGLAVGNNRLSRSISPDSVESVGVAGVVSLFSPCSRS